MKKTLVMCLVLAMSAASLSACSSNNDVADVSSDNGISSQSGILSDEVMSDEVSSDTVSSDEENSTEEIASIDEENSTEEENSSVAEEPALTNALFTWTFKLDGNEYTLPCDYSEFADNGWTLDESDAEQNVLGGSNIVTYLRKDDKSVCVYLLNSTDSSMKASECKIGYIYVTINDNVSFEFSDGFVFNSSVTVDDIIERYGNPEEDESGIYTEYNEYTSLKYIYSRSQYVIFEIFTEESRKGENGIVIDNRI